MAERERNRHLVEVILMGALLITWMACATILIWIGKAEQIVYITGVAVTGAAVARNFLRQDKQSDEAKADRQEIKDEVQEVKKKVNGGTSALVKEHEAAIAAIKEQAKAQTDAAIAALREEHHHERHNYRTQVVQPLQFKLDEAEQEIKRLREELARRGGDAKDE